MIRQPIRHHFEVCKTFKEVRHYQLTEVENGDNQLSEIINISKDRHFSNAKGLLYWLKLRVNDKFTKPLTGLKKTNYSQIFFGDIAKRTNAGYIPTHLLIFRFLEGDKVLIIDYYPNYYPKSENGIYEATRQILNIKKPHRSEVNLFKCLSIRQRMT